MKFRTYTFAILALVFVITGCNTEKVTKTVSRSPASSAASSEVPAKWTTSSFPLTVKISTDFSAGETSLIESMGTEWKSASANELTFFDLTSSTSNNNSTDLNSYRDGEMGIYKSTAWFDDVSGFALAITQFFGFRRNAGQSTEHIELTHADIMVNYKNFSFSTNNSSGTYDLPSVILHELGHFIGLYHNFGSGSSVMAPSLSSGTQKRSTFTADEQSIATKYGVNQGVLGQTAGAAIKTDHVTDSSKEGEAISGIIELRADGICRHYVNGKLIHSH